MKLLQARYEHGVLHPTEELPLPSGSMVNLRVVTSSDRSRWNLTRYAEGGNEDLTLANAGIEEWKQSLDAEDEGKG